MTRRTKAFIFVGIAALTIGWLEATKGVEQITGNKVIDCVLLNVNIEDNCNF